MRPATDSFSELQRDAAVPQPQAPLREGRTQDVSAQTFHARPIVRTDRTRRAKKRLELRRSAGYRERMVLATRVRIIACPPGEAPLSVRLAWVGMELPLTPERGGHQLAMTSGVVSGPRGGWRRIAALFLGRYGVHTGYAVNAREAVDLLQIKDPVAAAWWREHCGHMLDGKRWFLFPTASCERRP